MSSAHPRFHYGWIVLGTGLLVVFGSLGLTRFGYAMILPDMKQGLDIGNTEAGAVATASLVGYLALSVIGGVLGTRHGPRIVITVGLALAGVGMIVTGLAGGFAGAMVGQLIAGMGSGASNVPVMGLIASWVTPRRMGAASGAMVAGSSVGLIVVGSAAPAILSANEDDGWRICWFIFGGMAMLLSGVAYFLLRNSPSEKGVGRLGAQAMDPVPTIHSRTLEWARVYRSRRVWQLGLMYVAFGLSYIVFMTFFRQQLTDEGGYTESEAGRLYMIMGWVSLLCGIWGLVSDRIGRKRALAVVYLVHAAAFSIFGLWATSAGFTLSVVLFGLTAWSIPAIMTATCGDMVGSRLAPAALGFITVFFGVGQALGPIIAGAMADASGSLLSAYVFAGGVALSGAIGALCLKPAGAGGATNGEHAK